MPHDELIPSERSIFECIERVFAQGVRRPGYAADRWAEEHCLERFRELGLESARLEPVELPYWEPRRWSLAVDGSETEPACFPLPHSAPCDGLAPLVAFAAAAPDAVRGAIALYDVPLMRSRHATLAGLATWVHDPDGSFAESSQVLPFGREVMAGTTAAEMRSGLAGEAGAAART